MKESDLSALRDLVGYHDWFQKITNAWRKAEMENEMREQKPFQNMVCGFAFRHYGGQDFGPLEVLLIEKQKGPPGVIGCWNGPGGHVYGNGLEESTTEAMVRKFRKETGAETQKDDWQRLVEFRFTGGCVQFFVYMKKELPGLKDRDESLTEEKVCWINAHDLRDWTVSGAGPANHLRWLVPLALQIWHGDHLELPIVVSDKTPAALQQR